jgi:hypothetical protein
MSNGKLLERDRGYIAEPNTDLIVRPTPQIDPWWHDRDRLVS